MKQVLWLWIQLKCHNTNTYTVNWSHVACVITITGAEDLFSAGFFLIKGKTLLYFLFYLSLLAFPIVSVCSAALMTPGSWTLLLTSLWWASEDTQCSHQNGPDKEPFLPPSWQQLPGKDAHMPKHASSVQKSWFTHKPVGLKLSWNAKGIERNSKNARIRENAMDFLLLFEHYSGSHNKWCQLFLTW